MKKSIYKKKFCRVCKQSKLDRVFSFGPTPLANAFLTENQIDEPEYFYPLDVYFCHSCTFLQLGHVVDPELLFGDYVYVSSTSPVFIKHFENFADDITKKYGLEKKSLIVDIGSNDGILLKPFKKLGMRALGVEPARHIAKIAKRDGIPTLSEYFSVALAEKIVQQHGTAKIVTATNVFAHIDDLDEVIGGLKILLDKNGVFVIEAPYIIDFLKKRYFDLVYHEHLSYWAIKPLITLFNQFDMKVIDVEKVAVHGGSVRVFVAKNESNFQVKKHVKEFTDHEQLARLHALETYQKYAKIVQENKISLLRLLSSLKAKNKTIAGYGAPAKGNTLLNYFSIGPEILDYIVDDSAYKQGLFTPGKHVPVVSSKKLKVSPPDYLLILAWNFAESIMKNQRAYQENGGKFIIPVPKPTII